MAFETINIPDQCDLISRYEDCDAVEHVLEEDSKFIRFVTSFVGTSKWSYVINNGVITKVPICYFYFVAYKYKPTSGKRIVRIGFICWPRRIYATIDVEFNVYPRKSIYVNPHKAWCLPHSNVTFNVKLLYLLGSQNPESLKAYVRSCTMGLMSITCLNVKYDVTDLRKAYFSELSSYPSYRLTDILIYNQKLVSKTRAFMLLNCNCSFKTIANIPYCGCETLCSEIIPKNFTDAGCMRSSDVLFCAS